MDGTIALMLIEALLILLALSFSIAIRFISSSLHGNQLIAVDESSKDDDDGDITLTQTVSPPSSHIVVSPPATKYDVFLSFRGEDTRQNFASYLYEGLRNASIHTFMDHKLSKGEQISPVLLRTIEESQIYVIIFSKNYASSTWCMEELVHILECKDKFGRVVIPIFYSVDPSNIRKQNGSFGNGFDVLKQRFEDNQEKLQKWRNALVQSASLSGWDSNSIRPEFKLVEEIVKDILSKLNFKSSSHLDRIVGAAGHIENIKELLSKARIVGIWGMGGAGKTTIAKAIFQELKSQFDAFSFIEDVREQLTRIKLNELQNNCFIELLKGKDINIYDLKPDYVTSMLQRKKILLILDDMDNSVIAENLTSVCDLFGEGSRIIITSRNEQVLKNASAFATYHVPDLGFHDALYLFSLKAFKQHEPYEGYMGLSKAVVKYCEGNPLALVVLGCSLYGRGKEEWESALEKLNQDPPKDIVDVLKLSFDGLDDKQQNVFLDLAFLINEGVCISMDLRRKIFGSFVQIDISVIREKSLISSNNYIEMHNLVRKMGLEIARQQLFSRHKTPIRLWRHEDIVNFFICNKEVEAIRCLSLDLSRIRGRITWRASNFEKMRNLMFLKVYKSDGRKPSELSIYGHFDYLSEELRFLIWEEYPLPYVPLHFCENLITFEMPNSNIRQLWNGNHQPHFPHLEKIVLSGSRHLIALPDLSHTPKIEYIGVEGCENLVEIHSSTALGNLGHLFVGNGGPRRINIGGNVKGTRSGFVLVYNHLDLSKLSFYKARMKLFVRGKIITGASLKYMVMPLEEMAELRSLLPFLRKVNWLETPIEFGHDFNQHYYDCNYAHFHIWRPDEEFLVMMRLSPLRRQMINRRQIEMINDDQVATTLMEGVEVEDEEEEEEEDDGVIMEFRLGYMTFTRVPNNITRWSLLKYMTLRKSDIVEDSFLKSLIPLSHSSYRKGIKPVLDFALTLNIPPSTFPRDYHLRVYYNMDLGHPHDLLWFSCNVDNMLFRPNYDFVVEHSSTLF